ncbi:MAG: hypothetical protein AB7F86_01220 [Bdellovibrionales bacterium]
MKTWISFLIVPLGLSAWGDSGDVSTKVETGGGVTYFESEDHPMKMDWDNWTFCWGANAKSKTHSGDSAVSGSSENSGTIDSYANVEGPLSRMLVNRLQWESKFNKEDMTFRINIHRKIGANQERQERSTCTTHDWKYKVNKAQSKVETSVKLHVPDNVWVMRIKTLINHSGYRPVIDSSRPMPIRESSQVQETKGFELDGYQYFFTRPGEDFQIALNIDEKQVKDIDLVTSIEVTFVGHNRCEQTFQEVFGNEKLATSDKVASAAREAFEKMEASLDRKDQATIGDLHRTTLLIGCLMNRNVADGILYHNDTTQVQKLMSEVQSFRQRVTDRTLQDPSYKRAGDALKLLTQMSLASLTSNVLEHVQPFCEKIPIFNRSSGQKIGYKRGFVQIGENLKQARNLLGGAGFTRYFSDLFAKYQFASLSGRTHAQLMSDPVTRQNIVELSNLFEANNKVLVAHKISSLLAEMPGLKPNVVVVGLAESALKMEATVGRLHSAFTRELDKLAARSATRPDLKNFDTDIRALDNSTKSMQANLQALLALVDKAEGGPIASDFANATQGILTIGGNFWLAQVYGGYFADFLASIDPDFRSAREKKSVEANGTYKQLALEEVKSCLTAYSSLNN